MKPIIDIDPQPNTFKQLHSGRMVNSDLEKAWQRQKTIEQRKYEALYEQMEKDPVVKNFIKVTNNSLKNLKWEKYVFDIEEYGQGQDKRWYIVVTFHAKLGKQNITASRTTKISCRLNRDTKIEDKQIPLQSYVRDWAVPYATSFFERKFKNRQLYTKTLIISGGRGGSKTADVNSFSDWLYQKFDSSIEFARAKQKLSSNLGEIFSSDKFNEDLKEHEKELAKKEMIRVFDRWGHLGNDIIYDAIKEFEMELVFS